ERMKESVTRFHRVLPCQVVRSMAVVTSRRRMVAGFRPRVVLPLHRVAVGARRWIVQQIRVAPGVNERVTAHAYQHSDEHSKKNNGAAGHRKVVAETLQLPGILCCGPCRINQPSRPREISDSLGSPSRGGSRMFSASSIEANRHRRYPEDLTM